MSDRPSRHGTNDRRALGPGENGMRINPPKFFGVDPYDSVPELCSGCGAPLHGCALDSPAGFVCSMQCPALAAELTKLVRIWVRADRPA